VVAVAVRHEAHVDLAERVEVLVTVAQLVERRHAVVGRFDPMIVLGEDLRQHRGDRLVVHDENGRPPALVIR
jgi:hypothetical protein